MSDSAREFLSSRKQSTNDRFSRLQKRLSHAEPLVDDFATVYATGSFGRGEASSHSDVDVFILTETDEERHQKLTPLSTIRLQAAMIEAVEAERLPPLSDEGAYLKPHCLPDMIEKLGGRDDDYENLFTARILLLLESRPLLGQALYNRAVDYVLAEYWKDYESNHDDFLPIYLTNDIVRYWKVLCLNYEAAARRSEDKVKRRLNNYKLKHSRLLTCYSAILYLCHLARAQKTISQQDARAMTALVPIDRLTAIADESDDRIQEAIADVLQMYVKFLHVTDAPKQELLERFAEDGYHTDRRRSAQGFGEKVFELLKLIGEQTPLFRYLVV